MKKENAEYTEYSAYTADGKLLYVERSLKNGTDELTEYIWAGSTLWAEKRTTGTESAVYYHHTDYHGSTEAITDEEKVVVWKAGYDAYGNVLEATGEMEFEASFTGKMFDKDTGLYYFNARWYDSELGRFTTPDPTRDGTNWVLYCAANPVGRWDPTGLESKFISWIKGLFSGDEDSSEGSSTNQHTETTVVEKKMLILGDPGTSKQVLMFQPNLTEGAAQILKIVQESQEVLDWLDNTIPSWLTWTGSVSTDLDALPFAIAVLYPEIFVYQATLPLCEAAEYGSQLLLDGSTQQLLPASTYNSNSNVLMNWKEWPDMGGFLGGYSEQMSATIGQTFSRIGDLEGSYVSPIGTSLSQRGLPSDYANQIETKWRIVKPFDYYGGIAAPWKDSTGGGVQWKLPDFVSNLWRDGFIEPIQ